ncbi:enoyl-CoA hydratase-related protein [Blastococcus sp. URHD0036]|uniref:enoyl-CoA hydratase-related protein n=1 Tax=Blastococcus sp. URHD0036 TaxID=1380356 RepID=UPI00068F8AAA|nr:enoyl-CoA hydratase-related protein [Blastococcus sp. URHD0036]
MHSSHTSGLRESYDHLLVRREGHVLEVTINRPDVRNCLHPPANDELDEVFNAYFADEDLWVAILVGAGNKAFSSGADLAYLTSGRRLWLPENGVAGLTRRRRLPKPVIAAVNGIAVGGGFEVVLACHLVVADETAWFALPEVRVGRMAAAGGLARLPRCLPPKLAAELVLTGRRLGAVEAQAHGVVNRVVGPGLALQGARALAAEILEGSPVAVRASLADLDELGGFADTAEAVAHRSPNFDEVKGSADAAEGVRAFLEKRRPRWQNR